MVYLRGCCFRGCSCLNCTRFPLRGCSCPNCTRLLNTDTLVQLRQLHPLKQHPLRENALMLGVGYTDILDTYLSPEKYRGTDLRFLSHTRREKDSTCSCTNCCTRAASPLPTTARAMGAR